MATTSDTPPRGPACTTCAGVLAADQRYCLNCGTANPAAAGPDVRDLIAAGTAVGAAPAATAAVPERGAPGRLALLPGRDVSLQLAIAVFAFVLGIGAWAGARTTSGGSAPAPIAIAAAAPPATSSAAASAGATTDDGAGSDGAAVVDVAADTAATVDEPVGDASSDAGGGSDETTSSTDTDSSSGDGTSDETGSGDQSADDTPATPTLKHVWVISLADQGYDTLFDPAGGAPYLAKDLTAKGALLSHYHGATTGGLANAVALVSGQAPNAATQAGCPSVSDVTPGTVGEDDQAGGTGCLYSTDVFSIADLLAARGRSWRAYAGALDGVAGCPRPAAGAPFPAPRIPFLAFHTIIDEASCAERVTGLAALTGDLQAAKDAPTLSYVVPGPCEDGSATPCSPGSAAGLPPADAFLRRVVPPILASPAYADAGAVVILADQAPQGVPGADSSACCEQRPWQGTDLAAAGGGRTGALVLSPLVTGGSVVNDPLDHYDLLKSLSLAFGLRPPGYAAREEVKGLPPATWKR